MCIVSYLPPGIPVDTEGLFNGGLTNRDGHGWAIADKGVIVMGRSLNLVEAVDEFEKARAKHMGGPALFHSRIATHGSTSLANCHPFLVDGSHKTVLAHNGIMPHESWPSLKDDRSDSRFFADELLMQEYGQLDKFSVRQQLEKWAGSYNKIVILTVDPRFKSNAYLINQWHGQWDSETGIWHSNSSYKALPKWTSKRYGYSNYGSQASDDWDDVLPSPPGVGTIATSRPRRKSSRNARANVIHSAADSAAVFLSQLDDDCNMCGMGSVQYNYCQYCDSCQDCGDVQDNCVCWKSALVSDVRNPVRYTSETADRIKSAVAANAGKIAEPSGEAAKIAADLIARREATEYRGGS